LNVGKHDVMLFKADLSSLLICI